MTGEDLIALAELLTWYTSRDVRRVPVIALEKMFACAQCRNPRGAREWRERASEWRGIVRTIADLRRAPWCDARRKQLLAALRDAKTKHDQWMSPRAA